MLITGWALSRPGQLESFLLARSVVNGIEPAGSASYGLDVAARQKLGGLLEANVLPARRRNHRIRWVTPHIPATVDYHGLKRGPVRDPILRAVDLSPA